jgi:hypothetical protein
MGACGACLKRAPWRPSHADVPPRVEFIPSQGLVPLEGFAWHGCLRGLPQAGPVASFSRRCPFEGWIYSEPVGSCRSRVLRGMGARGACLKRAPWRPSHADVPSRVEFNPSRGLVPLEGFPCLARDRVIKFPTVEAAVSQRGCAFLGVAAARARVVGGVAGGRDRLPRSLLVFSVMMARSR